MPAVDLEAHDLAEAPAAQLGLDGAQQVVGLVGDLEVGVARDAEEAVVDDLHAREERVEVGRDDLLERDERRRPRPTGTKRGSISLGTFTRAKVVHLRLRVAHEDGERQRQVGDVGERAPEPDGERREDREDLAAEALVERLALARAATSSIGTIADAVLGQRRAQLVAASSASGARSSSTMRSRSSSMTCDGVRPSGPGSLSPASTWSCRPATRIMKNSSRFDVKIAANFRRSSSGMVVLLGELEHARR